MHFTRRAVVGALTALPLTALLPIDRAAAAAGRFKGSVVARWDEDGRSMTLIEPFEYIDPSDLRWPVPAGTVVDGASIPRAFWTIIGGPFEGRYRNASVVHDFYCQIRNRPYSAVHRMFYNAMVTSGLADKTSWLMYKAVEQFGPRWPDVKLDPQCEVVGDNYDFAACGHNMRTPAPSRREPDRASLEAFLDKVEAEADPRDIDKLRAALHD